MLKIYRSVYLYDAIISLTVNLKYLNLQIDSRVSQQTQGLYTKNTNVETGNEIGSYEKKNIRKKVTRSH